MKIFFNIARNVSAALGLAALISVAAAAIWFWPEPSWPSWHGEETEIHRRSSPNNEYDAVVTAQEPGAFGSSILRLYIVPSGIQFVNRKEYEFEVFRSETIHVSRLRWRDDRTLVLVRPVADNIHVFRPIKYDLRDIESDQVPQESWRRITVVLQTDECLVPPRGSPRPGTCR